MRIAQESRPASTIVLELGENRSPNSSTLLENLLLSVCLCLDARIKSEHDELIFFAKTFPHPKNFMHTLGTCEMRNHRTYASGLVLHKQRSGGGHGFILANNRKIVSLISIRSLERELVGAVGGLRFLFSPVTGVAFASR